MWRDVDDVEHWVRASPTGSRGVGRGGAEEPQGSEGLGLTDENLYPPIKWRGESTAAGLYFVDGRLRDGAGAACKSARDSAL